MIDKLTKDEWKEIFDWASDATHTWAFKKEEPLITGLVKLREELKQKYPGIDLALDDNIDKITE